MPKGLVVVAKLGVVGAAPPGLWDLLIEQHEADQHSPKVIHTELFGDNDRGNLLKSRKVHKEMFDRTVKSLLRGRSVFFDTYVNNPPRRMDLLKLTAELGATAVLLHPIVDSDTIIRRAVIKHHEDTMRSSGHTTPLEDRINIAEAMMEYVRRSDIDPDLPKNNVPHLCLDGTLPLEEIAYAEWLYARDLHQSEVVKSQQAARG